MTRWEQLLAACCGDEEQAELVLDVLAQRIHTPDTPSWCERCHDTQEFEPETGFCGACGHTTPRKSTTRAAANNPSGTAAAAQEGQR